MPSSRDNFRLGLTIIVMFALLFACLLYLGGDFWQRPDLRAVVIRFTAAAAIPELAPGSRVICFGQTVGEVTATRIIDDVDHRDPTIPDRHYLEVEAQVWDSLDLRSDCQVSAIAPPLGGKGSIDIVSRGTSPEPLPPDVPLLGETGGLQATISEFKRELDEHNPTGLLARVKDEFDAGDPGALLGKVHASLDDVNDFTTGLADLRGELVATDANSLRGKIHSSMDDINKLTTTLAEELARGNDDSLLFNVHGTLARVDTTLQQLVDLVQANRPAIDSAVASFDHAMQTVDHRITEPLADELDRYNAAGMLAASHAAFTRLNRSLEDLNVITAESKSTIVLNSARIDELVENVTEASALVKHGIHDLFLHPWKFMDKPGRSERRELHLFNAAREFAVAAGHLDDATSRLKALEDAGRTSSPAYQQEIAEIRAALQDSVQRFFATEQALWREMNGGKIPAAVRTSTNGR